MTRATSATASAACCHGWSKPGGAEETVRSSLSSAKARKATTVVKDIERITVAFDRADAAWKQLPDR